MSLKLLLLANLDAELELENSEGYVPSGRMQAEMQKQAQRLQESWAATVPGEMLLLSGRETELPPAWRSNKHWLQCWCPTPRALEILRRLDLHPGPVPDLKVLQQVNHRAFAAGLGQQLPGAAFVQSMQELDSLLAAAPARSQWLLKRPFGFSGRGRKRVETKLQTKERVWAEASMHQYGLGLQVEPWLDIEEEFAMHGWLTLDGELLLGQVTGQQCGNKGEWLATVPAKLPSKEEAMLREAGQTVGHALQAAAYHGPFNVDAYRYRNSTGALAFQACAEVNARLSMGYALGMAGSWPECCS